MAEHADRSAGRDVVERLALAALGVVALTADRIESLAGDLAERGGMTRDEARSTIEDAVARWRGDATRVTERAGGSLHGVFAQLGLVTRDEFDELELRVAQLEHRMRLVEREAPTVDGPAPR